MGRCFTIPGIAGVFCTRAPRQPCCSFCERKTVALCDHPKPTPRRPNGTCDARMCERHRLRIAPNEDRCPHHAKGARPMQGSLFGAPEGKGE